MRNNSFWLERMLWMVNCIRFRNVNDTYKDDMNSFWIGFTTWISQKNVRENLFTEEYVKSTGEKFEQNISFYNTQYRMYYEKEYPFLKIATRGMEEEYIKDFLNIMYELWVKKDRKKEFAAEVNRRLRKDNFKIQISDMYILQDANNEKDTFINMEFVQDPTIRIELQKDVYTILKNMQGNSIYRGVKENLLNDGLRDGLKNTRRYQVHDQTRHGQSESSKESGELDLLISTKEEDLPISIVEALVLTTIDKQNLKQHIDKALTNYNPIGCPNTIIIIYARNSNYANLMLRLNTYLGEYEYPYEVEGSFIEESTNYTESRHWKIDMIRSDKDIHLDIYAFNMP